MEVPRLKTPIPGTLTCTYTGRVVLGGVCAARRKPSIKSIRLWIHEWLPGMGSSHLGAKICVTHLMPLSKVLYSNCSVVRRSRKAVSPVYMYLNINTSVHVKEHHRLFEKSRGSSRNCWYFKTALIYSRFRVWSKGNCGPFESPLRRSNLGLLQSIQSRYRYRNECSVCGCEYKQIVIG